MEYCGDHINCSQILFCYIFGNQGVPQDSEGLTMLGFLVNRVNKVPHLQKEFLVNHLK